MFYSAAAKSTLSRKPSSRGGLLKSYNHLRTTSGRCNRLVKVVRKPCIYDWMLKKKTIKTKATSKNQKPNQPYNYELCKPKKEPSFSMDFNGNESDSSVSSGTLALIEERKKEWGVHLPNVSTPKEIFKMAMKRRIAEMRKRPKKSPEKIDENKERIFQRIFSSKHNFNVFLEANLSSDSAEN